MTESNEPTYPWKILSPDSTHWKQRTVLLYGPSGSGKTYLSAQFPKPLFLSCDPGELGGAISAEKFGVKHVKMNTYQDVLDIMPILQVNAGTEFETIIIDSATYLGKMTMKSILKAKGKEIPLFDEYKLNYARMAMLINNFVELHCHVVFTAIDKFDKDEVTGKMLGGPNLVGQLVTELPQAVDICARLFTQTSYGANGKLQTNYKYRVVPDDLYFAKDRTTLVPTEGNSDFETFIKPLFEGNEFNKGE